MERIALIPARGGSKGIPRKNIKLFNNKPLIYWTIKAALESNYLDSSCKFKIKKWKRNKNGVDDLGGGEMRVMRGKIFEKAGVNVSTVYGELSDKLVNKIPG